MRGSSVGIHTWNIISVFTPPPSFQQNNTSENRLWFIATVVLSLTRRGFIRACDISCTRDWASWAMVQGNERFWKMPKKGLFCATREQWKGKVGVKQDKGRWRNKRHRSGMMPKSCLSQCNEAFNEKWWMWLRKLSFGCTSRINQSVNRWFSKAALKAK